MSDIKKYTIQVKEGVSNYLERLYYDIITRERIIAHLIESHKDDEDDSVLSSAPFTSYHDELSQVSAEYEMAKAEFASKYIPKEFGGHNISWELDFNTNILIIECADEINFKSEEMINNG